MKNTVFKMEERTRKRGKGRKETNRMIEQRLKGGKRGKKKTCTDCENGRKEGRKEERIISPSP